MKKTFIVVIFLIIVGTYVSFNKVKDDDVSPYELLLIRASNAFDLQNYTQAHNYYAQALIANENNAALLLAYINSMLLSPEKNLTNIIASFKKYVLIEEAIKKLDFSTIQQIRALGMMDETFILSGQLNDPLLVALLLIDHDLNQAQAQLMSVDKGLRDDQFYTVSSEIHFLLQDYDEVVDNTEILLNNGFRSPQAYYFRAQALIRTGRIEESKTALKLYQILQSIASEAPMKQLQKIQQLMKDFPSFNKNTMLRLHYINALQRTEQKAKVKHQLRLISAEKLSVKNMIAMANTAMLYRNDEVMLWLHENAFVTHKMIGNTAVFDGLMCEYFFRNRSLSAAQEVCQVALKRNQSHSASLIYWNAQLMLKQQNSEQAVKALTQALHYAPWVRAWRIQLANALLSQGQIERASALFNKKMIDKDPLIMKFVLENGLINHG